MYQKGEYNRFFFWSLPLVVMIMRVLLFSDEAHLAPPVVVRLVQLQQLLALQHVHDLHLPLHVSPDNEKDHVVRMAKWWSLGFGLILMPHLDWWHICDWLSDPGWQNNYEDSERCAVLNSQCIYRVIMMKLVMMRRECFFLWYFLDTDDTFGLNYQQRWDSIDIHKVS